MGKYTIVGARNPSTEYTVEIILGRDEAGNNVSVGIGGTAEMTEAQAVSLSERFILEAGGETTESSPSEPEALPESETTLTAPEH